MQILCLTCYLSVSKVIWALFSEKYLPTTGTRTVVMVGAGQACNVESHVLVTL